MKIYAFVPARCGSKGLPDKNIIPIDGHPLMAYAIAFGRQIGIDKVIVSTDSPKYQDIALRYGAECPYLRGKKASSDTAMEEDILDDMSRELPKFGIEMPDIWVRLKPTNPFRSLESVRNALAILKEDKEIDSVRIVSGADCRLVVKNSEGFLEPLLPTWDRRRSVMRRSEFPQCYSPFNLDILRHRNWLKYGSAYMGTKIFPIVEHAITGLDIDNRDDFDLAKAIIEARPRPDFLRKYVVEDIGLDPE